MILLATMLEDPDEAVLTIDRLGEGVALRTHGQDVCCCIISTSQE